MNIKLYKNQSPNNYINKTLTAEKSITGTLRESCSAINPSIVIEAPINVISDFNYMEIGAFKRKYFITGIVSLTKDLTQVSGHCDVLGTYKNSLLTCQGTVCRSESQNIYNLNLDDPFYKKYQQNEVFTKKFPVKLEDDSLILVLGGIR